MTIHNNIARQMWKNVKLREEEHKRMREEQQVWINQALKLSKEVHRLRQTLNETRKETMEFCEFKG